MLKEQINCQLAFGLWGVNRTNRGRQRDTYKFDAGMNEQDVLYPFTEGSRCRGWLERVGRYQNNVGGSSSFFFQSQTLLDCLELREKIKASRIKEPEHAINYHHQ